jgi:TPR repeat protein
MMVMARRDGWERMIARWVYGRGECECRGWAASVLWRQTGEVKYLREAADGGVAEAAYVWSSRLWEEGGEDGMALSEYYLARAAEGGHGEAAFRLSEVLVRDGSADEAVRWLERSAEAEFGSGMLLLGLREASRGEQGRESSERWLLGAMGSEDREVSGLAAAALALSRDSEGNEDATLLRRAAADGVPCGMGRLAWKMWWGIEMGVDMPGAVELAKRAAAQGDSFGAAIAGRGLYCRGRLDEALRYFVQAAGAGDLCSPRAKVHLAQMMIARGDHFRALALLEEAAAEGDATACCMMAYIWFRLGQREKGLEYLDRVLRSPEECLVPFAKTLMDMGEGELAAKCFAYGVANLRAKVESGDGRAALLLADALGGSPFPEDIEEVEKAPSFAVRMGMGTAPLRLKELWLRG